MSSKSHVQDAVDLLAELDAQIADTDAKIAEKCKVLLSTRAEIQRQRDGVKEAVEKFILLGKRDFDNGKFKITRVQGHRRKWNVEKLNALVPRGIFKNLVDITPNPDKIEAAVRKGKVTLDQIAEALEETPNNPYIKWTAVSGGGDGAEATGLAAALDV